MDARTDLKGAVGAFLLFGAVAAFGVIAVYAAVEDYARARASLSWRAVEGVVLSSDEAKGVVRYAWFDDGQSHIGERVRFWTGALQRSGEIYAAGASVKVRVSPDDGSLAVIEPGAAPVLFVIVLGFGAALVFIGLAGLIRLTMLLDGLAPARREYEMSPAE